MLELVGSRRSAAVATLSIYLFARGYRLREEHLAALTHRLTARHRDRLQPGFVGILGCEEPLSPLGPSVRRDGGEPSQVNLEAIRYALDHSRRCGAWWDVSASLIERYWATYVGLTLSLYLFLGEPPQAPLLFDGQRLATWRQRAVRFGLSGAQAVQVNVVGAESALFPNDCGVGYLPLAHILSDSDAATPCRRIELIPPPSTSSGRLRLTAEGERLGWEYSESAGVIHYSPGTLEAHLGYPLATWIEPGGAAPPPIRCKLI